MVLDTSVLIALLEGEPEAGRLEAAVMQAPMKRLSAVSFVEASIVMLARRGPEGMRQVERLVADARIRVDDVTARHAELACEAYRRFGKGRHPAGLNLGDCFSYALAVGTGEPLLFKGSDFARTNVATAAW